MERCKECFMPVWDQNIFISWNSLDMTRIGRAIRVMSPGNTEIKRNTGHLCVKDREILRFAQNDWPLVR